MDKKAIAAGVFLIFAALASLASAKTLAFVGSSSEFVCQGEQQTMFMQLMNSKDSARVFSLEVQGLERGFTYFLQPAVEVSAASSATIPLFVNPYLNTTTGTYVFEARASDGRESYTVVGSVIVGDCHNIFVSVPPTLSSCTCETTTYPITVTNAGNYPEAGVLSTDLNPALYTLSDASFSLNPGESKQVFLHTSIPCGAEKQSIGFRIMAKTNSFFTQAFSSLEILSCSNVAIGVPATNVVFANAQTSVRVVVENKLDSSDSLRLKALCPPFASLSATTVVLGPREKKEISLVLNPSASDAGKTFYCTVVATSEHGAEFAAQMQVQVAQKEVQKVFAIKIVSVPQIVLEKGAEQRIFIGVKNIGQNALSGIRFMFPKEVKVVRQDPFNLLSGEQRNAAIVLEALEEKEFSGTISVFALEAAQDSVNASIKLVEPTLTASLKSQETINETNKTIRTKLVFEIKNSGPKVAVVPLIKELRTAIFFPSAMELNASKSKEISVELELPKEFEENLTLALATDRGTYNIPFNLSAEKALSITGLFAAALSFGPIAFAIIVILLIWYLVYRKREAPEEKDEKLEKIREEIEEEEANREKEEDVLGGKKVGEEEVEEVPEEEEPEEEDEEKTAEEEKSARYVGKKMRKRTVEKKGKRGAGGSKKSKR
jgi:hypothetical protein